MSYDGQYPQPGIGIVYQAAGTFGDASFSLTMNNSVDEDRAIPVDEEFQDLIDAIAAVPGVTVNQAVKLYIPIWQDVSITP